MKIKFFLLFIFPVIIFGNSLESRELNCNGIERLSESLNSLSYLGFNEEFTFHDQFLFEIGRWTQDVFFNLTQTSSIRFHITPFATIWLYNSTGDGRPEHLAVKNKFFFYRMFFFDH